MKQITQFFIKQESKITAVQGDGYETGCLLCYPIAMGIIIW